MAKASVTDDWIPNYVMPRDELIMRRADRIFGPFVYRSTLWLVAPGGAIMMAAWWLLPLSRLAFGLLAVVVTAAMFVGVSWLAHRARQQAGAVVVQETFLSAALGFVQVAVGLLVVVLTAFVLAL